MPVDVLSHRAYGRGWEGGVYGKWTYSALGGAWDLPPASASPRVNLDCVTPLSESRTPPPPRVPSLPCGCRSRDLGRGFRPPEIEEDGSESC